MDGKHLWASPKSFSKIVRGNGKYLHWVTDIKDELPIIIESSEFANIPPETFNEIFDNVLVTHKTRLALRYKVNNN